MKTKLLSPIITLMFIMLLGACTITEEAKEDQRQGLIPADGALNPVSEEVVKERLEIYALFKLTADISHLSEKEKQLLPLLFEVAEIMNEIFWQQAIGNKESFLNRITDEPTKQFAKINYGPWDRLNNNKPFIDGIGKKPAGANFYPVDMTKEEFDNAIEERGSLRPSSVKLRWKCVKFSHTWYTSYQHIYIGKGCAICFSTSYEKCIELSESRQDLNFDMTREEFLNAINDRGSKTPNAVQLKWRCLINSSHDWPA
ncbi:MAG: hypothetical protein KAV70_02390, partial [Bacteroidales bacterium]|nr:hypothetical protein [Bacteroidales bacterium]